MRSSITAPGVCYLMMVLRRATCGNTWASRSVLLHTLVLLSFLFESYVPPWPGYFGKLACGLGDVYTIRRTRCRVGKGGRRLRGPGSCYPAARKGAHTGCCLVVPAAVTGAVAHPCPTLTYVRTSLFRHIDARPICGPLHSVG